MKSINNYSGKLIISLFLCIGALVLALVSVIQCGDNNNLKEKVTHKSTFKSGKPDTIKHVKPISGSTVLKKKKPGNTTSTVQSDSTVFTGVIHNDDFSAEIEVTPIASDSLMELSYNGRINTMLITRTDTVFSEHKTEFYEQQNEIYYFLAGGVLTGVLLLLLSFFIN